MSLEVLDVGQANELKLAFRSNNLSNEDVKRLCEGDVLSRVRDVLHGYATIRAKEEFVLNLSEPPPLPKNWQIISNKLLGDFKWDPSRFLLLPAKRFTYIDIAKGRCESGWFANFVLLNFIADRSNMFFMKEWRGKFILGLGTALMSHWGEAMVPSFDFTGPEDSWDLNFAVIPGEDRFFGRRSYALVLKD